VITEAKIYQIAKKEFAPFLYSFVFIKLAVGGSYIVFLMVNKSGFKCEV
jgi:hypothetical protein